MDASGQKSKDLGVRISVAAGVLLWDRPSSAHSTHSIILGQTKTAELVCVSNYPVDITVRETQRHRDTEIRVMVLGELVKIGHGDNNTSSS